MVVCEVLVLVGATEFRLRLSLGANTTQSHLLLVHSHYDCIQPSSLPPPLSTVAAQSATKERTVGCVTTKLSANNISHVTCA